MIIREVPPGIVYKLHNGTDPYGLMGMAVNDANPSINRGRMSARVRITRETPDRARDVMIASGGIVDDHKKNPTVQFQHSKTVACGRAEDPLGTYTVHKSKDGAGWDGETYFSQATKIGEQAFRLVESKAMCGASVGFMPVYGQIDKSHAGGTLYKQWRLVEYSHVVIPEHPDCLVEAVYKGFGGQPLCPELDAILRPMCPERPASVVGGWTETITTKGGTTIEVKAAPVDFPTAPPMNAPAVPATTAPLGDPLNPYPSFASLNVETAKAVKTGDYVRDGDGNAVVKSVKTIKRTASVPRDEHNSRSTAKDTLEYEVVAITVENARGETVVHKVGGLENAMTIHRLKPKSLPSYLTKAVQFRNTQSRFLPGLRRKAMDEYDDPNGGVALEDPTMEGFIPEEDEGSGMKAGAEFNHGLADILTQAVAFIEDGKGTLDNATVLKNAEKVAKWLGKALAALHAGHGDYLSEHPDQPALPGNEGVGEDMGDEDDEDTDDEDDDESDDLDIEDDDSETDADDTGDDSADDKPKKKKKKPAPFEKAFSGRGYLNSYWEDVKLKAVRGDGPIVTKAIAELKELAGTKTGPAAKKVQEVVKSLSSVLVVKSTPNKESPAVVADESMPFAGPEWQAFFAGSETIGT
jgi:hypothetical protein